MEDRPRYNQSRCFDPFPFPDCNDAIKARIRDLAEQLDSHRKRQQSQHPKLTLTDMYNALERLRSGEPLSVKEKNNHDEGLVSVLKQIHDELDAAVFAAYGWPATLSDEEILERLVALNAERAAEEARGLVRWLRPEFQNPAGQSATQQPLDVTPAEDEPADDADDVAAPKKGKAKGKAKVAGKQKTKGSRPAWPDALDAQAKAVLSALRAAGGPISMEDLAATFHNAKRERVGELLQTLVALGQARLAPDGRYST